MTEEGGAPGPVPLTSMSTTWYGRVVPAVSTVAMAAALVAIWSRPSLHAGPHLVEWAVGAVAVVASFASFWWFGRFQRVWLDGDYLVIGDVRRGFRVRLQDVGKLEETRLQKMKWVKLVLSRPTPLGSTIRFIPRGPRAWLAPWTSSPLVEELCRRIAAAKEESGAHRLEE